MATEGVTLSGIPRAGGGLYADDDPEKLAVCGGCRRCKAGFGRPISQAKGRMQQHGIHGIPFAPVFV